MGRIHLIEPAKDPSKRGPYIRHKRMEAVQLAEKNGYVPHRQRPGCWQCVHAEPRAGDTLRCVLNRIPVGKHDHCVKLFLEERHVRTTVGELPR